MKRFLYPETVGGGGALGFAGVSEVKRSGRQANIGGQSPRKNKFLPLIEKVRMCFNQSNNRRLLPTPSPSLIREGESFVSRFTFHSSLKSKIAFTLAEVLITLGIIGVVAALTLPALIDNHNKSVVEARLEKFYSSMNQAIRMAELDYGPREYWFENNSDRTLQEEWCKKYIIPYMNVIKYGTGVFENRFFIYFSDGSAVAMGYANGRDWLFFPGDPEKCTKSGNYTLKDFIGLCAFAFYYNPTQKTDSSGFNQWNFEPYMSSWDGKESSLKNHSTYGCNENSTWPAYCTRWIQFNGWKIPKDYPFKVKYR